MAKPSTEGVVRGTRTNVPRSPATLEMGKRIAKARAAKGWSVLDLTIEVDSRLPQSRRVTDETIRTLEHGRTPRGGADPVLVAAIAEALEVPLSTLDKKVAQDTGRIVSLLAAATKRDRTIIATYSGSAAKQELARPA